jgi:hypothetical protein
MIPLIKGGLPPPPPPSVEIAITRTLLFMRQFQDKWVGSQTIRSENGIFEGVSSLIEAVLYSMTWVVFRGAPRSRMVDKWRHVFSKMKCVAIPTERNQLGEYFNYYYICKFTYVLGERLEGCWRFWRVRGRRRGWGFDIFSKTKHTIIFLESLRVQIRIQRSHLSHIYVK